MKQYEDVTCSVTGADGKTRSSEIKKIVEKITCNGCEAILWEPSDGETIRRPQWVEVRQSWGFDSKWDLENHEFHLCQDCYGDLISKLKQPVSINGYFIGSK